MKPFSLYANGIAAGANPSKKDSRDFKDGSLSLTTPYPTAHTVDMDGVDVFHQGKIGICTAAALCSIIEWLYLQKTGKHVKLSVAFLYIVTKLYIDKNWEEGSSLRSALKAAYKYGVCLESTFPTDITLSHQRFLSQSIPENAWTEALEYTIGGYISVPVDRSLIAAAMYKYGPLYARMEVSDKWFTPSWYERDIAPLVGGKTISGHAVALKSYDLISPFIMWLRNSWGITWFRKGDGYFLFKDYRPTEVWAVTLESVMHLSNPLDHQSDSLVKRLMDILRKIGSVKLNPFK